MKKTNYRQAVIQTLFYMGISPKAITDNSNFSKDLGLDSLDISELMMELELKLKVEIPFYEVEKIQTVKEAVDFLNQQL
ncbi:MAG: acyl carrier protein [Bacteroidota bacterium]